MLLNLYLLLFAAFLVFGLSYWFYRVRIQQQDQLITSWEIRFSDFGILLWVPIALFIFVPMVIQPVIEHAFAHIDYFEQWKILSFSLASHISVIAFAVLCLRHNQLSSLIGDIQPSKIKWTKAILFAMSFMALMYPFLLMLSIVWDIIIEQMTNIWPSLDFPDQNMVKILQELPTPYILVGLLFAAVVLAPISEEFVFRGLLYRYLRQKISPNTAAVISGVFFAAIHFNIKTFPLLCVVGFFLAYAYQKSGSLRVPIIFHMMFNAHSCIFILLS